MDHILHDPVRGGGAGGDPHPQAAGRQEGLEELQLGPKRLVLDAVARSDSLGRVDVEGADAAAFGDFLQVGGVGGVVAADHHHQVERFVHQGEHGVLALLGGIADGVEGQEVLLELLGAVAAQHRALEQPADFLGFALEHGGLVGNADAHQVPVGIEAR